jgi:hypothetical protein
MHQTILSAKKVDSRIVQEINDTEENSNSKLFLFDRVETVNQEDHKCTEIRKILRKNKKSYDEMLLKKFKSIENILFFKKKVMNIRVRSVKTRHNQRDS